MLPDRIRTADALHALAELAGLGALAPFALYAIVTVDVTDHPAHAAMIVRVLVDMTVTEEAVDGRRQRVTAGKIGGVWAVELNERLADPQQPAAAPAEVPAPRAEARPRARGGIGRFRPGWGQV